jgi:hypothetical protein
LRNATIHNHVLDHAPTPVTVRSAVNLYNALARLPDTALSANTAICKS